MENPASVVKELVENSIDAGADSITVSIENGGIKSITVNDNGCGMEKEDLDLSILPHATSKISAAEELDTVSTLGFRGEALASIVAVSEFTLKSRYFESDIAYSLEVKGGEKVSLNACALNCGTSVSVKSLFFNTPARYKFLKNTKGEENSVTALMAELILANTDISFRYDADGKTVYRTNGEGLEEAIFAIYGPQVGNSLIPVDLSDKKIRITGFTAQPATDAIKNNRKNQTFIINGRIIDEAAFSAVIQNAYGERLMKRTFPTVILDIIMPFDEVDVNVHPNKREVRFANPNVINGLIYHAIKKALENYEAVAAEKLNSVFGIKSSDLSFSSGKNIFSGSSEILETVNTVKDSEKSDDKSVFKYLFGSKKQSAETEEGYPKVYNSEKTDKNNSIVTNNSVLTGKIPNNTDLPRNNLLVFNDPMREKSFYDEVSSSQYRIVGQVFSTYLLAEIGEELYFIDQHAAHERIIFDKLLAQSEKNVAVQDLIIPFAYRAEENSVEYLKNIREDFAKLGFNLDFTDGYVYLKSIPAFLDNLDYNAFLSEIVLYNKKLDSFASSETIKDIIARTACRRAIKGGRGLSEEEIKTVLDFFFEKGVPMQCPHGRPTLIKLTKREIEKMFGRKI